MSLFEFCLCEGLKSWKSRDRSMASKSFVFVKKSIDLEDPQSIDQLAAKKPWRFVTSSARLAQNLGSLRCTHERHCSFARKSILDFQHSIPSPLCRIMIESVISAHKPTSKWFSMPCIANQSPIPHRARLVTVMGRPSHLKCLCFESGIKSFRNTSLCTSPFESWRVERQDLKFKLQSIQSEMDFCSKARGVRMRILAKDVCGRKCEA